MKAADPIVARVINALIGVVQWGFKDRNDAFIPLNVSRQKGNRLYYFDEATNSDKLVSNLIQEVRGGWKVQWLAYLLFKDGFGNEISLKKHISQRHGLHFT